VLAEGLDKRINVMKNGVFWDVTPCGSCKTDVSEELSASFIKVTRIGELGTTLALTTDARCEKVPSGTTPAVTVMAALTSS
jgi:hypothetical protein